MNPENESSSRGLEIHGKYIYVDGRYLILGSESAEDLIIWLERCDNEITELGVKIDTINSSLNTINERLNTIDAQIVTSNEKIDVLETLVEKLDWERVAEIAVTSPETEIAVEGLDLDTAGAYNLILSLVNPTAGNVAYSIYFNDDREDAHYWRQVVSFWHQGLTQARVNNAVIVSVEPGEAVLVEATLLRGADGLVRYSLAINRRTPAEIVLMIHALAWTIPENVTKLEVVANVADGIGVGSRLKLHKMGGEDESV